MNYYSDNYQTYIEETFNCQMDEIYNFFEKHLKKDAKDILDLGFGSGRDSLYFLKKYNVTSLDVCKEFCDNGVKIGLPRVINISAQEMELEEEFDGIFACASLLHVPSIELNKVFKNIDRALRNDGILYSSFKNGEFEGIRNERFYLDLNEKSIVNYLKDTHLEIIDILISEDVRNNRNERWLNVIMRKRV